MSARPRSTAASAQGRPVAAANGASSSTQAKACAGSPARTAAPMRSTAAIRCRAGSRIAPKWCSAAAVSPWAVARVALAQRARSYSGSVRTPNGWVATTASSWAR
jgi:hypothetical protein